MFYEDVRLDKGVMFLEKRGSMVDHALHIHDVLEYHILLENEATFKLSDREFAGRPGDVFLFRPFEPHWNLAKDVRKPIRWISILFSPSVIRHVPDGSRLLLPFYAAEAVSPLLPASSPHAQAIQRLAAEAVQEERDQPIGWETRQFTLFLDILLHTLRYSFQYQSAGSSGQQNEPGQRRPAYSTGFEQSSLESGLIEALEYMLEHFTEEIDVEELVRMSGKQRTFFYRHFRSLTGVTPNQFIHRLRMQVALYMLAKTNKPVTEIALECGYASIPYFNKRFLDFRGVSPRAYRLSVQRIKS